MSGATRDLNLPFGCINSGSLRALADAIDRLDAWHRSRGGRSADRPCLRRIESNGEHIQAHVSTGPAVGGEWLTLMLDPDGWTLVTREVTTDEASQ